MKYFLALGRVAVITAISQLRCFGVWVVWERGIEIPEEPGTSIFKVVSGGSTLLQNKYLYQNIRQNRSLDWQLLFSYHKEMKPDTEEFTSAGGFQRIHSYRNKMLL
jgi:hypothetical protein